MRRVAITGAACITALGLDRQSTWAALCAGRCGVGPIRAFDAAAGPVRAAAEVAGLDLAAYVPERRVRRLLDRRIGFAIAAAVDAAAACRLPTSDVPPQRRGTSFGSGQPQVPIDALGAALRRRGATDPADARDLCRAVEDLPPLGVLSIFANMVAAHVAMRLDHQGPSITTVTDGAAGLQAVGTAARWVRAGASDAVLAGGADASIHPLVLHALSDDRDGLLSRRGPGQVCGPFAADRDGITLGEGAGCLAVEALERARERGAPLLAEVAGYAEAGLPLARGPAAEAWEAHARALELALERGGIRPAEIDAVVAAGLGTRAHDASEARAIAAVVPPGTPVTGTKGALGHTLAAAGGIDLVVATEAMRAGLLPPVARADDPDPALELALVRGQPLEVELRTVAVLARSLGGLSAALILRRAEP